MKHRLNIINGLLLASILVWGCAGQNDQNDSEENKQEKMGASYASDLQFLKQHDADIIELTSSDGNSRVIVSAKYQGKVFTSTASGKDGKGFGWINYKAFEGEPDAHMNAYGGEDRLWLGPEGGPFSLYFAKGDEMVFDNWHTPAPIDTEPWEKVASSDKEAELSKDMRLTNYAGTTLDLNINRKIAMLNPADIESQLDISIGNGVQSVGFSTVNTLTNTGDFSWDKETGAPCMWNLDMFTPSPETVILVPYNENTTGKIATTDYFGEIDADRIEMKNGMIYFKADGKSRGKLGVPPNRAKNVAGSYSADNGVLTVTLFDIAPDAVYLNQEWTTEKDPFDGDAVNAYNDGPLEDGSQMGPFLEVESVSPAAFLDPKGTLTHKHSVFHFSGDKEALNQIAEKVFGVSLDDVSAVFNKK